MVKVLVTGGRGQLAKCIKMASKRRADLNISFEDSSLFDITNSSQMRVYLSKNKDFEFLINCAAYTNVDLAEKNKDKAYQVNAEGAEKLAKLCKEFNIKLVHISTDFVFDGSNTRPYKETDVPNPSSVYGASKLQGEKNIMERLSSYFIIRTSWLYSEFGSNFVKTILRLADTQKEIKVVSDQIGSPTNAHDLADFLLEIISINSTNYGTYHFSNTGETSWYGFAEEVFRICNVSADLRPISSSAYASLANRPKYSVLDTKKGKETFNVNPDYWVDSLKKVNFNL
jgi:dTDP-4-dehydrorhamnose reductase